MRLIVMGQQAFGKDALAKVLETGTDEVVAVYCEPDRDGKSVDPIKTFALEKGLPVHQPAHFKDQATLDQLASYNADLMIMAFVNVFVHYRPVDWDVTFRSLLDRAVEAGDRDSLPPELHHLVAGT